MPTTRRAAFIINLLIWVGLSVSPSLWPRSTLARASADGRRAAQSAQKTDSLEPGKPIERELSGGQSHSYKITMISGQYLQEVDSEHIVEGLETVSTIAEMPGAYLIEARSAEKTARAGRYGIKVEELRAATAEDKYRVAGEVAFRDADRLKDGTMEARRKSVEKYYEVLELYRRVGIRSGEATLGVSLLLGRICVAWRVEIIG